MQRASCAVCEKQRCDRVMSIGIARLRTCMIYLIPCWGSFDRVMSIGIAPLRKCMIFLIPRRKVFWQTACHDATYGGWHLGALYNCCCWWWCCCYCASKMPKTCETCMGAISVLRKQRENAWGQFCFLGGNIVGAISAW